MASAVPPLSISTRPDVKVDIPALLPSWQRSLRAARRSPRTVQSYTEAAEQLEDFLVRPGMPTAVDSMRVSTSRAPSRTSRRVSSSTGPGCLLGDVVDGVVE